MTTCPPRSRFAALAALAAAVALAGACSSGKDDVACGNGCSADGRAVVDCDGTVVQACGATQTCDVAATACADACALAAAARTSVGCDFYAVRLENVQTNACFAVYVANTSGVAAHLAIEYDGAPLALADFARLPSGFGPGLTFGTYDPVAGLAPGAYAVLFLAGTSETLACPAGVTPPVPSGGVPAGTGLGLAFRVTSDVPVAAWQINPFGGSPALTPGASLLLPTTSWDTNYLAATAAPANVAGNPALDLVAAQDNTTVTLVAPAAIAGGGGLAPGTANLPYTFTLNRGQVAQLSQPTDLNGTVVQSDKPIGLFAANSCMQIPVGTNYCEHGEQMLPPVRALGSEYVAAMFRPRVTGDAVLWRIVGAVDGTTLAYAPSAPSGAPATLGLGQEASFFAADPFTVTSQDAAHPFLLLASMTGSEWASLAAGSYGDPDVALVVPPVQFANDATFVADPTFPETNLVVIRSPDGAGLFQEVTLDCAGALGGWQTVGGYEWTRVDLTTLDYAGVGACTAGWQHASSEAPFGIAVWGWGTPNTTVFSGTASYGFPAFTGVGRVNDVVVPAVPR